MQVLGYMALAMGAMVALSAVMQEDLSTSRGPQFRLAVRLAIGGAGLLVLHFLAFTLPHLLRDLRSPTQQRRRAQMRSMPAPIEDDPRRGGVLVLTLVLLALLTLLLVQAQALARGRLRAETSADQSATLRRAATESVWSALQRLADDADLAVDTTNETWAAREEITSPLGISTMTRVQDGARRFDLNNLTLTTATGVRSSEDVVMDLMTMCGDFTPVARVAALRDYLDQDRVGLYEADFCAKQVPPVACPNRLLYSWGELLPTAGWSRDAFQRHPQTSSLRTFEADLVDSLTLIPLARERPLPININTASRETLTGVLGLGQDALVAAILTLRSIKPIRDLEALSVMAEPGFFETVQPYLSVRSSIFEVESLAYANGRTERVRALASRGRDGRVDVVQWLF
jgi:type II secretory pathway component PulK